MTRVFASISAHGFGHMAITAPVLERLHALCPDWAVTVASSLPEAALRRRLDCPFRLVADDLDFGLRMRRDLTVDTERTLGDYDALHNRWDEHVASRAKWLAESEFDAVLANISYLNIAAAHHAGIPVLALSPLNWADLYRHYAPPGAAYDRVFEQMVQAYNRAHAFLAPQPRMPMPNFTNVETIPPVVQVGNDHGPRLRRLFGLKPSVVLLLLALGGQEESEMFIQGLPRIPGAYWLADEKYALDRDDILPANRADLTFPDLLASSDLLVCKPGYGAFAEAACLGKPVVYVRRPHWPEERHLIAWLETQVPCREAPRDDARGLADAVADLLDAGPGAACPSSGVGICCDRLAELVG